MFQRITLAALAAFAFLVFSGTASAAEQDEQEEGGSFWVTSGFFSKHTSDQFAPKGGYNETNTGIGIEYGIDRNWTLAVGTYKNSVYKRSTYIQGVWTPDATTYNFGELSLKAGLAVGVVNGYPDQMQGGFFPAVLPVLSAEYKRVGVNLTYIPSLDGAVDGAVALQLKFKFF